MLAPALGSTTARDALCLGTLVPMAAQAVRDKVGWARSIVTAVVLAALAVGVAIGEQGRNPEQRPLDLVGLALLLGGSLPVSVSRRWPRGAYLVTLGSIGAYQALGYTINSPYFLGILFTAYAAAAAEHRWRSAVLALLALPAFAVGAVVRGQVEMAFAIPAFTAVAFIAGQVASEIRAASARSEARVREEEQLRMLTEERLRIARELHDVISHSIATIGVQAGVAAHVIDEQPEQAREALLNIKSLSRDAMRDLRGMLRVLRQSEDDQEREPAPGLARLPELIERARISGVQVQLDVQGAARSLTPATDLAAYRAVQEALTNVIRHAPGASAQVRVRYDEDFVQIEVVDDGGAARSEPASVLPGTGHGLSGLRERAAALGGTFEAARLTPDGFRVCLSLPTGAAA